MSAKVNQNSSKTVVVCQLCQGHMPATLLDQRGICPDCAAYNHANQGDKHLLSLTSSTNRSAGRKGGA